MTSPRSRLRVEIGHMCLLLIFDADQRSRKARDLEFLGDDQCYRLAIEKDFGRHRADGRVSPQARCRPCISRRDDAQSRPMRVGEHVEHAFHRQRIRSMDPLDAALGNGGRDHEAVREPGHVVFGRVFRSAGDLRASVDAGGRLAEMSW